MKSVVGPMSVAVGANPAPQTIDAYNAGDGTLNLSVTSSDTWLSGVLGSPHNCGVSPQCTPIQIGMQMQSMAQGIYTGTITVSDPNAIDAPQTISVTVQVGGGFPDSVNLWVSSSGVPASAKFKSNSVLSFRVANPANGPTVSVGLALDGNGSFAFAYPYSLTATAVGVADGNYTGSVTVNGSSLPAENKSFNVNLHVTSQPIAALEVAGIGEFDPIDHLHIQAAQTSAAVTKYIRVNNLGSGALSITSATPAAGAPWLTASIIGNLVGITVDPNGLSPGTNHGSVVVATNAANSSLTLPVQFDVIPAGPPVIQYQGVREGVLFAAGDDVAQGGWVSIFGDQLSLKPIAVNPAPYSSTLGDASVFVNDQPAPVYFTTYGQINFLIPFNTPPGQALVRVDRDGQRGNSVSVNVVTASPRILRLDQLNVQLLGKGIDYGAVINLADGSYTTPPIGLTDRASHPAHVGDNIVFFAFGLGQTNPASTDGVPGPSVDPLPRVPDSLHPMVNFGGGVGPFVPAVNVSPQYMGLSPTFVGLYQINAQIPQGCPTGNTVALFLTLGTTASNVVNIAVQ